MSQFFESDGQSIGVSASVSVLPMNIQDWFPLGWTDLISLQSKGLSRVFSNTTVQKASILQPSAFFIVQLSHPYMTTGKTNSPLTFVGKVMSLLFNMLSRLVIAFLPRSKWKYWCASFYCDLLYCTLQMLHFFFFFYKWEVCGNCFEQVYWWHSPPPPFLHSSIRSLHISVSHFGNPHNISKNFYFICYGYLWC